MEAADITTFDFLHDPSGATFRIQQCDSGSIGAKLYPGALLLCAHLRTRPLPAGSAVVELGAGVCALPSLWLSRSGCRAIATDAPAMLPLLAANVARAGGGALGTGAAAAAAGGALSFAPFEWGVDDGAAVAALRAGLGGRVDFVVAADVVYHDPLIAPLLGALRALTDAPPGAGADWAPPVILLAYVQRFKRARRFFKLAAAHFDVVQVAGSMRPREGGGPAAAAAGAAAAAAAAPPARIVDYDALTWAMPKALRVVQAAAAAAAANGGVPPPPLQRFARLDGQHTVPLVRCDDAGYDAHCALLEAAGGCCGEGGEGGGSCGGAPAAAAAGAGHGAHRVGDSDSGDEWEDPRGAAEAFSASVGAGLGASAGERGAAAAARLGVPLAAPVEGSVWELRRRRAR